MNSPLSTRLHGRDGPCLLVPEPHACTLHLQLTTTSYRSSHASIKYTRWSASPLERALALTSTGSHSSCQQQAAHPGDEWRHKPSTCFITQTSPSPAGALHGHGGHSTQSTQGRCCGLILRTGDRLPHAASCSWWLPTVPPVIIMNCTGHRGACCSTPGLRTLPSRYGAVVYRTVPQAASSVRSPRNTIQHTLPHREPAAPVPGTGL